MRQIVPQKVWDEWVALGVVACDFCGADYTESDEKGGLVVANHAVCPKCAPRVRESADRHGELHAIHNCPCEMTFADFIREFRKHQVHSQEGA